MNNPKLILKKSDPTKIGYSLDEDIDIGVYYSEDNKETALNVAEHIVKRWNFQGEMLELVIELVACINKSEIDRCVVKDIEKLIENLIK